MLTLTRLPIARQRRVELSLSEFQADKAATKGLHADVRAGLSQAVATGARLDAGRELPALYLDNTADTVFGAFEALLEAIQRGLDERVIKPLTAEQARKKAAASTIQMAAFPDGMAFLTTSMPLQYDGMRGAMDKLRKDAEVLAAVKELGLGYLVDHMEAHLAPYGRAITTADNRDLEAASDAFHAAFLQLYVQTSAHHAGDADLQKHLFGAYETELAAQRAEDRAARQRAKAKKTEAAKTPA